MPQFDRDTALRRIENEALIAVLRVDSAQQAIDTCRALRDGGVVVQEIAMTTPGAAEAIERCAEELDDCLVGAGTVLDAESAERVIEAGAAFVFAPNVNPDVIETTRRHGRISVPGALTPTEIANATSAGADLVKLFPAHYFGPRYLKDLRAPMPDVRITPTGGINLDNAATWLDAGAVALGVGSAMVRKELIRAGRWTELTDLARQYVQTVQASRG
jgi:2-dehydro-3-deoxyphosphogluconate aldolase/(4S)-4-hydroxy-2-oxoglutarate aldolase